MYNWLCNLLNLKKKEKNKGTLKVIQTQGERESLAQFESRKFRTTMIPLMAELAREGLTYTGMAIRLNDLGLLTQRDLYWTGPYIAVFVRNSGFNKRMLKEVNKRLSYEVSVS